MIRLLNCLISMDDNRLTKCVFFWTILLQVKLGAQTWNIFYIRLICNKNENKQIVNLEHVKICLIISTNKNGKKNCKLYQNSEPM